MKKIISFILSIAMLLSTTPVFATSFVENEQMEKMAITVKQRLEFQDSEKFKSDYVSDVEDGTVNKEIYNLNWDFKEYSISVGIREDGVITNYSYRPREYKVRNSVLFNVTKAEATQTANDFIKRINPDIYQEYELVDVERVSYLFRYSDLTSRFGGDDYIVSYVRKINNIPFKHNTMTVHVSGYDNIVTNYSATHHYNVVFDEPKPISLNEAKNIFKENLDLQYSYEIGYNYEEINDVWEENPFTRLVYEDQTEEKYIDANSGQLFKPDEKYFSYRNYNYGGVLEDAMMSAGSTTSNKAEQEYFLTEEERQEIAEIKDVLPPTQVLQIAKDTNLFEMPENVNIKSYRLYKEDDKNKTFNMSLIDGVATDRTASLVSDANTGEVLSYRGMNYGYSTYHSEAITGKLQYAVDFAKKYYKHNENLIYDVEDKGLSFKFNRTENGIPCYDNYINVGLDKNSNKVDYYQTNWTDVTFISPTGTISTEEAKSTFADNFEYSLFYYLDEEIGEDLGDGKSRGILAYSTTNNYSDKINAHTREFLNYSLEVLKYPRNSNEESIKVADKYTDIDNHWAKDIILLMQNNNVGTISSEFKPDEKITYGDLFELLGTIPTEEEFKDFIAFTKNKELLGLDFINKETKLSDTLTREQFCTLMISIGTYNYDKIIDNSEYFNVKFADKENITKNKLGYIAIAQMLNYISNGENISFRPQDLITRAEAITYLYNIYTNL